MVSRIGAEERRSRETYSDRYDKKLYFCLHCFPFPFNFWSTAWLYLYWNQNTRSCCQQFCLYDFSSQPRISDSASSLVANRTAGVHSPFGLRVPGNGFGDLLLW